MARMKIVKLKEFFGLMEKDGLAVPDLVRSLGDTISISIGHKF